MRLMPFILVLFIVAACDQGTAPSVARHPMKQKVTIDETYVVSVVPQSHDVWVASGGRKRGEKSSDPWVEYRRMRAIEIASGCRIHRVTSKKGEPLLTASVNQCRK